MKDLKHLIYFENLLEDANNELVRQAQENGSIVLGYTCYHIPEVLLNVDNCISVRLRAPKTGSLDISTYYMSNYTSVCPARSGVRPHERRADRRTENRQRRGGNRSRWNESAAPVGQTETPRQ